MAVIGTNKTKGIEQYEILIDSEEEESEPDVIDYAIMGILNV